MFSSENRIFQCLAKHSDGSNNISNDSNDASNICSRHTRPSFVGSSRGTAFRTRCKLINRIRTRSGHGGNEESDQE
ncbi:hypothetical protein RRG08_041334 [Elysia crispata]|uniref:Uncharacterized protein n=1 Tax=Elysia crispata TaxID=231223 RepID=A0AAE1A557_9GAST|nr:hypothetical protein RRG08_041334 [Elysia crispata]